MFSPPKPASPHPLELSGEAMRAMVRTAMDHIVPHVASLADQRMHATAGGRRLARSLRELELPEEGVPFEQLARLLFGRIIPRSLNTASPGYLAYIPGGGIFHSAVADLITDAVNRYVGVWLTAPGLVQLEVNVLQWFCRMLGLPRGAGGLFTTGGSLATWIAVVTARRERLPPDFLSGTLYVSDQAHHSVQKAAMLAGFPAEQVREIPSDERYRLRIDALERSIAEDRARGQRPFLVVGGAGTTNTGAVDDLAAIADVAARERLWFHVDAAYGGFFALTERGRATLAGIERADSVTLDPHKGLFLPYGTGCLVVRDAEALRRAHSVKAVYLPPMQSDDDLVDFCEIGPELSRDARGLRVWLPLKMHGARAFREALDEKLDLARRASEALARIPGIELVAPPELSLLAFRIRPPDTPDGPELDAFNRKLMSGVNRRQRVLLTGTVVRLPSTGREGFVIRVCILNFRTHQDRVDAAIEDLVASLAELRA